jgi:hypothetical protein
LGAADVSGVQRTKVVQRIAAATSSGIALPTLRERSARRLVAPGARAARQSPLADRSVRRVARDLLFAILVGLIVFGLLTVRRDARSLDCGPDGKPALDGRACIDRQPVTVP